MNARLHTLLTEAEAQLAPKDQDRLAEFMAAFVATHTGPQSFTPEELAHLQLVASEPFVAADPAEVAAFFARRD